jgi:hypothetical protein
VNRQEGEVYLPFLGARLRADEAQHMFEGMEAAAKEANQRARQVG